MVLLPSNQNKRHVPFSFKLGKCAQLSNRGNGKEDRSLVYHIAGDNIVSFVG